MDKTAPERSAPSRSFRWAGAMSLWQTGYLKPLHVRATIRDDEADPQGGKRSRKKAQTQCVDSRRHFGKSTHSRGTRGLNVWRVKD